MVLEFTKHQQVTNIHQLLLLQDYLKNSLLWHGVSEWVKIQGNVVSICAISEIRGYPEI